MEPRYSKPEAKPDKHPWGTIVLLGCTTVTGIVAIGLILLALLVPRVVGNAVEKYTSTEPLVIAEPAMTEEALDALVEELDAFGEAIDEGRNTPPLELSETEVNALLWEFSEQEDFGGRFRVELEEGRVRAHLSLPLDQDLKIGPFTQRLRGRYINGVATVDVSLAGGEFELLLDSFEVNGAPVPDWALELVQAGIDDIMADESEEIRRSIRNLDSIEVTAGGVTVRPATSR